MHFHTKRRDWKVPVNKDLINPLPKGEQWDLRCRRGFVGPPHFG
jgi:hypothetical protein